MAWHGNRDRDRDRDRGRDDFRRGRGLSEEEGEIGEEEGEILPPGPASAAPRNEGPVVGGGGGSSSLLDRPLPSRTAERPVAVPSMPRRASWQGPPPRERERDRGGRGAPNFHRRGSGGGMGNRTSSFTGAVPPERDIKGPPRSQSLSNFQRTGNAVPPSDRANASAPAARPTDPRFRAAAALPVNSGPLPEAEPKKPATTADRDSRDIRERERDIHRDRLVGAAPPASPYHPKSPGSTKPILSVSRGPPSSTAKIPSVPSLKPTGPPQRLSSYSSLGGAGGGSYSSLVEGAAAAAAAEERSFRERDAVGPPQQDRPFHRDREGSIPERPYHRERDEAPRPSSRSDFRHAEASHPPPPEVVNRSSSRSEFRHCAGPRDHPRSPAQRNRTMAFPGGEPRSLQRTNSNPLSGSPPLPLSSPAAAAPGASPGPTPQASAQARPAFHLKDPRFAKQQQQQQQEAATAAATSSTAADTAAFALRGNSSATDIAEQGALGASEQLPRQRPSWTAPPNAPGPPLARSHSAGAQASRQLSYPTSPEDQRNARREIASQQNPSDSFGRSREWLRDSGSGARPLPQASPRPPQQQQRSKSFGYTASAVPPLTLSSPSKSDSFAHHRHSMPEPTRHHHSGDIRMEPIKEEGKPSSELEKKKPKSPLLTTVLGETKLVSRADGAVQRLQELFPAKNKDVSTDLQKASKALPLPTKVMIMKAMATLDIKIKQTQEEGANLKKEIETAKRNESQEIEEEAQKLLEKEQEEQSRHLEERRQQKEEEHDSKMKNWYEERKQELDGEQKQAKQALEEKIQKAQQVETKRLELELEEQVQKVSGILDKDIAKVRRDFEKHTQAASKSQAKAEAAEEKFRSSLEKAKEEENRSGLANRIGKPTANTSDLVKSILAENQRKAAEGNAMTQFLANAPQHGTPDPSISSWTDPKYHMSCAEWTAKAKSVTGLADALYREPSEAPFYQQHEENHQRMFPVIKEYVRAKKRKLEDHWAELAEEYDYRKRKYNKHLHQRKSKQADRSGSRASVSISRHSILGGKSESSTPTAAAAAANAILSGRSTSNPYRRARRGNEVRSEYEQEQIIADLAAKEAMEKRITFGGCKTPRQIVPLEQRLTARYINTLESQRVDPVALEEEAKITNVWSDMEKCIFFDRFLQHPKDFRKIASFLRHKTTKDCVQFYYDSKQTVPYKAALKEHMMRRKRRGDYPVWDATIQAAISLGAVITAGPSETKPLIFSLPEHDCTYFTRDLHPIRREIFDKATEDESAFENLEDDEEIPEAPSRGRKKRLKKNQFFTLDQEHKVMLRTKDKDSGANSPMPQKKAKVIANAEDNVEGASATVKRSGQKWTAAEKKIFAETLEKSGRNWPVLAAAVGSKTISQIKNYYYDFKKQSGGKIRMGEKKSKDLKARREEQGLTDGQKTSQAATDLSVDKEVSRSREEKEQKLEELREEERKVHEELQNQRRLQQEREEQAARQQQFQQEFFEQQKQQQMRLLQQQQEEEAARRQAEEQQRRQQQEAELRRREEEYRRQQEEQQRFQQGRQQGNFQNQQQQQLQEHLFRQQFQQQRQQQQQQPRPQSAESSEAGDSSYFRNLLSQQQQQQQQQQHGSNASTNAGFNLQQQLLSLANSNPSALASLDPALLQHLLGSSSHQNQNQNNSSSSSSNNFIGNLGHLGQLQHLLGGGGGAAAQMQLLALRQQQQQQQQQQQASSHTSSASQLRQQLALAGLTGLDPGALMGNASASQRSSAPDDNDQVALAQRLLAFGGRGGAQDTSALDALGLLASRAAQRPDGAGSNLFQDRGRDNQSQGGSRQGGGGRSPFG